MTCSGSSGFPSPRSPRRRRRKASPISGCATSRAPPMRQGPTAISPAAPAPASPLPAQAWCTVSRVWPMILIGGASETYRGGMGAIQEERQVLIASPFCKFTHGIESAQRIPYYVEMATRNAIYGRPGATYLDVPDDIITGKCDVDKVVHVERAPDPPRMPPRCSPSDAPFSRGIEHLGVITSRPILGGLHH